VRKSAVATAVMLMAIAGLVGPSAAVTTTEVSDLTNDGRLLDFGSDAALDTAIEAANAEGIAFVWLDRPGAEAEAQDLADRFVLALDADGSRYRTVLVVLDGGYAASSLSRSDSVLDPALDAAFDGFASGAMGRGLTAFLDGLGVSSSGGTAGSTTGTTTAPAGDSTAPAGGTGDTGEATGGGGIGFGSILAFLAVIGGGFLAFRAFRNRSRDRKQADLDLAEDRAEIKEQLKNNADRVITLGDRVIASGNSELIDLYEKASQAYQDVSQQIDGAATAAEVDRLDDRIDEAEWQFEVIEADLDDRPRPPRPADDTPEVGAPGQQADGSVERDGQADQDATVTSPRTGRSYPRSTGRRPIPGPAPGRSGSGRRGGGLGGALGGGLGGILADVVLGGATRGRRGGLGLPSSRRTTRRRTTGRSAGSLGGRGLGGGVLRRGGSSSGSRSTRGRGGRSFGNRRPSGRGGRSF
jgi:hypothetical protein